MRYVQLNYIQVDAGVTVPCVTLAFAPAEPHLQDFAKTAMQSVAATAGLRYGVDVVGYNSPQQAARVMFDHLYLRQQNKSSSSHSTILNSGGASTSKQLAPRLDTVVIFTSPFHYELW